LTLSYEGFQEVSLCDAHIKASLKAYLN
jgi:hypothetical protein